MTQETLETYSNTEVIAVSQDSLGKQGTRLVGGALSGKDGTTNVWSRTLADGSHAMVFLNVGALAANVTCGPSCFGAIALDAKRLSVRDVWAKKALPDLT
eukprot:CAMPEP_0197686414 /NCGR_PEP_ID=MMETSP1338-20131121/102464_1 /TAXON_ID=43686 ORGANISM="Pelagodinium beii, Strain RCC1491" /NCGR_SAMPLE_ID=MMETSP1338 /ASSEMBLY_ACC=CAM_ASM_000754 /LENGTH=99 /DNA_ID=CAMNT_0043268349 /DNA_START=96 /DNA_END=392 /DNA_ORIENTATION=-